jgi:hypothetical protein
MIQIERMQHGIHPASYLGIAVIRLVVVFRKPGLHGGNPRQGDMPTVRTGFLRQIALERCPPGFRVQGRLSGLKSIPGGVNLANLCN